MVTHLLRVAGTGLQHFHCTSYVPLVAPPMTAQTRAVANMCKFKYKNIYIFRDRQKGLRKNSSEIIFFLIKSDLVRNFQKV